jgi:hypothetical protein
VPSSDTCDRNRFWLSFVGPLVFWHPTIFRLFDVQLFWLWTYLVKVIPKRRYHLLNIFIFNNISLLFHLLFLNLCILFLSIYPYNLIKKIRDEWVSEWVLNAKSAFFSAISTREQDAFQWDDVDVNFILIWFCLVLVHNRRLKWCSIRTHYPVSEPTTFCSYSLKLRM